MGNPKSAITRRRLVSGTVGLLAAPAIIRQAHAKSNSVTFTGWGGTYQEILIKYGLNPFTEETGIKVNIVPAPELAKVKAQLITGNVEWDVYENSTSVIASGSKAGFWEKLDLSTFDLQDMVIPPASDSLTFSTTVFGIAWNPKKHGPGMHPTNFTEYFDLRKFPGRRTFRNSPPATLEAALLADGVEPKDMYPLDVDRAFRALARIKPSIASWIAAVPETISLVQSGEVDFSFAPANRVKGTNDPGGGVPLAVSFEQNIINTVSIAVLKGAPNKENGMKLIAYLLRPEVQARVWEKLGLGSNSKKAVQLMPSEARKWLADMGRPNNLIINNGYWADNLDALSVRFKEWILS